MTNQLEFEPKVIQAINRGRNVEAIKLIRESRGIGLKEAKDLVDQYCARGDVPSPVEYHTDIGKNDLNFNSSVIEAITKGQKIKAIKLLRQSNGLGLKEAKDLVERYVEKHNVRVASTGDSGVLSFVAVAIVVGLVGYVVYKSLQ